MTLASQTQDESLDVAPAVDHGRVSMHLRRGLAPGARLELGRMHCDAAGAKTFEAVQHEVEATLRATEMFETTRRPQHVEVTEIRRDLRHVDRAERHVRDE